MFRLEEAIERYKAAGAILQRMKDNELILIPGSLQQGTSPNRQVVIDTLSDFPDMLELLEQYQARLGVAYPVYAYILEQRQDDEGPAVLLQRIDTIDKDTGEGIIGWIITKAVQSGITPVLAVVPPKTGWIRFESFTSDKKWNRYLFSASSQAFTYWEENRERIIAFASEWAKARDDLMKGNTKAYRKED